MKNKKEPNEVKPNFAPVYACLYPELARIFVDNGYALAVHGSMVNDFDLIAVPWGEKLTEPLDVLKQVVSRFAFSLDNERPTIKNHGRIAYTISLQFGSAYLDISFLKTHHNENTDRV